MDWTQHGFRRWGGKGALHQPEEFAIGRSLAVLPTGEIEDVELGVVMDGVDPDRIIIPV